MKLPFSWGRDSEHTWKVGVDETVVVIQRQTQRKDPACGWWYNFRLQPSLSKDQNNSRGRAVQGLGAGQAGFARGTI